MEFDFDKFKDAMGKTLQVSAEVLPDLILNAAQQRKQFPQCGKRPLFIGKRRNAYDSCVQTAMQTNASNNSSSLTVQDWFKKNYIYVVGAALITGVVIYNKRK